jgi:hypothetical protein
MGMQAYITGVGYFNKALKDLLEYQGDYYNNVQDGALILSDLTVACATSARSRDLAEALRVNIDDPTTWWINNPNRVAQIDVEALKTVLGIDEFKTVMTAWEHGFNLFFRPGM